MKPSIFQNIRAAAGMLPRAHLWRWAVTIPLGIGAAVVESVSAACVFGLIAAISNPAHVFDLPMVGYAAALFPLEWQNSASVTDSVTVAFLVATAVLLIVRLGLSIGMTYYQQKIVARDRIDFSIRLFHGYLAAPYAFHLRRNSSDYVHRINTGISVVFESVLGGTATLVNSSVTALALLAVLFMASPIVTVVATVLLSVWIALTNRVLRQRVLDLGRDTEESDARANRSLLHGFAAMQEIKILGRERYFREVYAQTKIRSVDLLLRRALLELFPRLTLETIFVGAMLIVTSLVLAAQEESAMVLPVLGLYGYVGSRLLPMAHNVIRVHGNILSATAPLGFVRDDWEAIKAYPAEPNQVQPGEVAAVLPFEQSIVLDHVSFSYAGTQAPVLHEVSLRIEKGEQIGVVGRSGAGKSTLIHILLGLLQPSAGSVTVDGRDVASHDRQWRRRIGFVSQAFTILNANIRENVALGLDPKQVDDVNVWRALEAAQISEFVAGLEQGLDTPLGDRGVRISGGQRQRIAIARALFSDPDVLFFDEATAALDTKTEREVSASIAALGESRTTVLIAHRTDSVRNCDRIVVLNGGRVDAIGNYDELLKTSERFQELVNADWSASSDG
ncbi:MAG: ABC-type multidrug transport system fused ATPase/permease subunit [Hyphomicrobiaceae bacterium]